MCITGLLSHVRYHDEAAHLLFAKDWYELGKRPLYSKFLDGPPQDNYRRFYVESPLWQFGLVNMWKLCGDSFKSIAQVYQAIFYLLLLLSTYLVAKEFYNSEKIAIYSVLLIATMPLFIVLGIMFFIDILFAALITFCFYFLLKKKYLSLGCVYSLLLFSKRNAIFFLPVFVFLILIPVVSGEKGKTTFLKRLKNLGVFIFVVVVIITPEFSYRYKNFNGIFFNEDQGKVFAIAKNMIALNVEKLFSFKSPKEPASYERPVFIRNKFNLPGRFTKPLNWLKYIGITMFLLLYLNKSLNKKTIITIIIPMFAYLLLYLIACDGMYSFRHLSPVLPLFSILLANSLATIKNEKITKIFLVLLCLQFISASIYISSQRRIDSDMSDTFNYIKTQIPRTPVHKILTPDDRIIPYYTNRLATWPIDYPKEETINLLFGGSEKSALKILKTHNITYILIDKSRIYDDSKVKHFSGYPKSFVDKISSYDSLEKVFENRDVCIWKVQS